MPLQIKLPAHERIIINGAVIENGAIQNTLILHTKADILRRKDVMNEESATTPARLIYYTLQCAYIFVDERPRFLTTLSELMSDYQEAAPSAQTILDDVRDLIAQQSFYSALRQVSKLLDHEGERFDSVSFVPPTQRTLVTSIAQNPLQDSSSPSPHHEEKSTSVSVSASAHNATENSPVSSHDDDSSHDADVSSDSSLGDNSEVSSKTPPPRQRGKKRTYVVKPE